MKQTAARKNTENSGVHRLQVASRAPRAPRTLGVGDQVRIALRPKNRLEALCGLVLGGFVPVATFVTAHGGWTWMTAVLVVGGLVFSAKTVFDWCSLAFGERAKALGFVLLIEGVMVASPVRWLSLAALALLVGINGTSTGCRLARKS